MKSLLDQDYKLEVVGNMQAYGGSFVKALSLCIIHADLTNLIKIQAMFADYVEEYDPENWKKEK